MMFVKALNMAFFSSMCSATGITLPERKRFVDIVCDEADGRMLTGVNVAQPTLEESLELLAHAENAGCTHAFVSFPSKLRPESEHEVYNYYRQITDSTNLGIVLYGFNSPAMQSFHPSGYPSNIFDKLANIQNVIAMKLTQPVNPTVALELCERLGDRLLIGPACFDLVPLLARHYNIQWSGQWIVEAVQSPENQYAVEFMRCINDRRFDEAVKIYWKLEPAYRLVHEIQAPLLVKGGHPWAHMRYFQWCVGGNGGLSRDTKHTKEQVAILDAAERRKILDTYRRIGIEPVGGPEEEFIVGRANYAKGIRCKDLTDFPLYA